MNNQMSLIEIKWSQYLEKMIKMGLIKNWQYTILNGFRCFEVREICYYHYTTIYQIIRVSLSRNDVKKLRKLRDIFPEAAVILVLPNCRLSEIRTKARKYVNQIIYANLLFTKWGIK
jgi:hypothetical protein